MLLFKTIKRWLRKSCPLQVSSRTHLELILHQPIEQILTIQIRNLQRTTVKFTKGLSWGNKSLCRKKKTRSLNQEETYIKSKVLLIFQKKGFERLTRLLFWSTKYLGMSKILNLRHFAWLITQSEFKSKSLDSSQDSTHQKSMKLTKVHQSSAKTIPKDRTNTSKARKIDLSFTSVVITSLEKWFRKIKIQNETYQSWISLNANNKRSNLLK